MQKIENPISLLAGISTVLLSIGLLSQPVICAFVAALRVNTQTVEMQLSQVPCRITCEPGFVQSKSDVKQHFNLCQNSLFLAIISI